MLQMVLRLIHFITSAVTTTTEKAFDTAKASVLIAQNTDVSNSCSCKQLEESSDIFKVTASMVGKHLLRANNYKLKIL